jgi:hypothetical protein
MGGEDTACRESDKHFFSLLARYKPEIESGTLAGYAE